MSISFLNRRSLLVAKYKVLETSFLPFQTKFILFNSIELDTKKSGTIANPLLFSTHLIIEPILGSM